VSDELTDATRSGADDKTIAQAIDEDLPNGQAGWCWKNKHCGDHTMWHSRRDCLECKRIPDIGEHNVLKVIEWWRKKHQCDHNVIDDVNQCFQELMGGHTSSVGTTNNILYTIASAIRASK